jgi:hypothetical protein
MAKRYSRYEFALKTLRNPAQVNDSAEIVAPPSSSALYQYYLFTTGQKVIEVNRTAASNPGKIEFIAIQPFGLSVATTNEVLVPFSNRAAERFSTFGGAALYGHKEAGSQSPNLALKPAQAIISQFSGTTTPKTSSVTKVPYKRKEAQTYTVPFGATATDGAHERSKQLQIISAIEALNNVSVTFKPETWKIGV